MNLRILDILAMKIPYVVISGNDSQYGHTMCFDHGTYGNLRWEHSSWQLDSSPGMSWRWKCRVRSHLNYILAQLSISICSFLSIYPSIYLSIHPSILVSFNLSIYDNVRPSPISVVRPSPWVMPGDVKACMAVASLQGPTTTAPGDRIGGLGRNTTAHVVK